MKTHQLIRPIQDRSSRNLELRGSTGPRSRIRSTASAASLACATVSAITQATAHDERRHHGPGQEIESHHRQPEGDAGDAEAGQVMRASTISRISFDGTCRASSVMH
jgi:uncharacterized low-complexity protein